MGSVGLCDVRLELDPYDNLDIPFQIHNLEIQYILNGMVDDNVWIHKNIIFEHG